MQITRTEITRAIGPSGQSLLRVFFCGDGTDCVTVEMADDETAGGNDETTLDRARTMLVQAAEVNLPINDYDARSNGNFDEVALTAANGEEGDVYVFEYRDGEGSRQIPPSKMLTFEAARAEAIRCAIDLLVDLQPGTDDLSGWLVRVRGENGELLCSIDAREADAARQKAPYTDGA
jgi:hypothetical protein